MKSVFTFEEIRMMEIQIIKDKSIPSILLMENAGMNSFEIIKDKLKDLTDYDIYIVCGKGNNAGDGFTIARYFLINDLYINLVTFYDSSLLKGDALNNYNILKSIGDEKLRYLNFEEFKSIISRQKRNLIIDALQGTGIRGMLDYNIIDVINFINNFRVMAKKTKVISVDIPSGLMSGEKLNPIVNADLTITMGSVKTEMLFGEGKENSGEIYTANIGVPEILFSDYNSFNKYLIELGDIKELYRRRKKNSYKYSNGKLLIIGGSKGLSGAVMMSSLSALKSGCGAVVAAIPQNVSKIFNRKLYEIMTLELEETEEGTIKAGQFDKLKKRLEWADTVLLGPGISTNESTQEFVFEIIKTCKKNLVIDADALNILSTNTEILKKRNSDNEIILTPHIGEFSRITKLDSSEIKKHRFEIGLSFAKTMNVNLVLKDETTVSFTRDGDAYINSSGNEVLATAGSGDVLSGIIASVYSQTKNVKAAMLCGNFIHGYCADIYVNNFRNRQSATPQDLIKLIPKAVSEILDND